MDVQLVAAFHKSREQSSIPARQEPFRYGRHRPFAAGDSPPMRTPFSPLHFFLILLFVLWIVFAIKLELIALTFAKLGLAPDSALLLLTVSLIGSAINLPLMSLRTDTPPDVPEQVFRGLLRPPERAFTGHTVVAVNVGGCLVPLFFSFFLIQRYPIPEGPLWLAIAIVSVVSHVASRPVAGLGITMPVFVAPVSAALAASFLDEQFRAPLAYIAGSLGVLIGADLARLKDVRQLGAAMASIGGAGTFDGIFMTGLVAVLLT